MSNSHIVYCFECDYSNRTKEKQFLKDIVKNFTKDEIEGFNIFVNNNPYNLQFHILLYFNNDNTRKRFDIWLIKNHPHKSKRFGVSALSLFGSANIFSIVNEKEIDFFITKENNQIFLFPDKDTLEREHPQYVPAPKQQPKIFLSHSSVDKTNIVEPIFDYLQSREIPVWFDKYEIDYGDNIYQKVSKGIGESEFAIFVVTENFLKSKWANEELSAFAELIFSDKSLVIIDIEDKSIIPRFISARKYLEWNNGENLSEIENFLKRKLNV